ncbi:hypothetical protein MSG28_001924 [Choristoneura fumiferana]|uniref:Uncharacterized protein n=1 Tax=Choristoneura fumiferana TaxID=7141 RepID=A0ACC0JTI8_CHOFU|nr:hypothetical protein MSG28_001924 [Choristoneura fumiferana]
MNGSQVHLLLKEDESYLKHGCKEFRCEQSKFCVSADLTCDGVDHCADGSDENTAALCPGRRYAGGIRFIALVLSLYTHTAYINYDEKSRTIFFFSSSSLAVLNLKEIGGGGGRGAWVMVAAASGALLLLAGSAGACCACRRRAANRRTHLHATDGEHERRRQARLSGDRAAGKLGAPCGPARVQSGAPGPPQGAGAALSAPHKDEWFV